MSLKRALDSPLPDNRTRKRLCSTSHSVITASNISLNTPLTAYPPRPFDSPRNPFGRKWAKHTTRMLPAPISWMRHIFLRFQFVRIGSAGALYRGVHRIVRVPLNYTFAHLRCLIAWLFCGQQRQSTTDEHLFEVKKNAKTYSFMYKPGQLKSGQTWAKISNTQDHTAGERIHLVTMKRRMNCAPTPVKTIRKETLNRKPAVTRMKADGTGRTRKISLSHTFGPRVLTKIALSFT